MEQTRNLNAIKADLRQHSGTSQYFHQLVRSSVYTDGAKDLFVQTRSWWLYDIIQSEVFDKLRKDNVLDTFNFKIVSAEDEAKLTLQDYTGQLIWSRDIEYTDFPTREIDLVCGWDGNKMITCLPSEN